jgi:hypothetical protein
MYVEEEIGYLAIKTAFRFHKEKEKKNLLLTVSLRNDGIEKHSV